MGISFFCLRYKSLKYFILTNTKEKKIMYIKIKDENPSIKSTRQMRTRENTTQPKNKIK
jgi:hypothetical protein